MTIPAGVEQVYDLFMHLDRYPELFRHVRTVEYYDDQNSRWDVDVLGRERWDAYNEGWYDNRRIGIHGSHGREHAVELLFEPIGEGSTLLLVRFHYPGRGQVDLRLDRDLRRIAQAAGRARAAGRPFGFDALSTISERGVVIDYGETRRDQRIRR